MLGDTWYTKKSRKGKHKIVDKRSRDGSRSMGDPILHPGDSAEPDFAQCLFPTRVPRLPPGALSYFLPSQHHLLILHLLAADVGSQKLSNLIKVIPAEVFIQLPG